jgi:NAD+ kinase
MKFQRTGLFSKHEHPDTFKVLQAVVAYLQKRELQIVLEARTAEFLNNRELKAVPDREMGKHCDLIISVGGDGNLLHVVQMAVFDDIPVVGINCGRIGFLTDIKPQEIDLKLGEILNDQYQEEKRLLLQAKHPAQSTACTALNEVTLSTETAARMIEFEIYVDDQFLCRQRSNGIIVSTPTGSTAYALSAGGSILHPNLSAIVLAPMLSHTLSNRPIVVSDQRKIRLALTKASKATAEVYYDNRCYCDLGCGEAIDIQRMDQALRLIHPRDYDYFETLRDKLGWVKNAC